MKNSLEQRITKSSRAHIPSDAFSLELCVLATEMLEARLYDAAEIEKRLVLFIVWKLANQPELESVNSEEMAAFIHAHQPDLGVILRRFNTAAESLAQMADGIHKAGNTSVRGNA